MIVHSIPFTAKANDGARACMLAFELGGIPFLSEKLRMRPAAFPHLKLKPFALAVHRSSFGIHIAPAVHMDTNMVLEVKQPSARNTKSIMSMAKQLVIWEAAEAKRARKQEKNLLDAGKSISEGF